MATNVHLHVCFSCDTNDGVAALAAHHLTLLPDDAESQRGHVPFYVRHFLTHLAGRIGPNPGPKGGLSLWGMVGGNTDVGGFCEMLRPFWMDLLAEGYEGGPCTFERVIVFEEREQRASPNAYEIGWDREHNAYDSDPAQRTLVITKHERLPFSWGQF